MSGRIFDFSSSLASSPLPSRCCGTDSLVDEAEEVEAEQGPFLSDYFYKMHEKITLESDGTEGSETSRRNEWRW